MLPGVPAGLGPLAERAVEERVRRTVVDDGVDLGAGRAHRVGQLQLLGDGRGGVGAGDHHHRRQVRPVGGRADHRRLAVEARAPGEVEGAAGLAPGVTAAEAEADGDHRQVVTGARAQVGDGRGDVGVDAVRGRLRDVRLPLEVLRPGARLAADPRRPAEVVDRDGGRTSLGEPLGERHVVRVQPPDVGQHDDADARLPGRRGVGRAELRAVGRGQREDAAFGDVTGPGRGGRTAVVVVAHGPFYRAAAPTARARMPGRRESRPSRPADRPAAGSTRPSGRGSTPRRGFLGVRSWRAASWPSPRWSRVRRSSSSGPAAAAPPAGRRGRRTPGPAVVPVALAVARTALARLWGARSAAERRSRGSASRSRSAGPAARPAARPGCAHRRPAAPSRPPRAARSGASVSAPGTLTTSWVASACVTQRTQA